MATEITEQEFRALKTEVESARSEADKAQGSLDTLMKRLKDEYGCKDLKAAQAKLKELKSELDTATEDFEEKHTAYEKKWKKDD